MRLIVISFSVSLATAFDILVNHMAFYELNPEDGRLMPQDHRTAIPVLTNTDNVGSLCQSLAQTLAVFNSHNVIDCWKHSKIRQILSLSTVDSKCPCFNVNCSCNKKYEHKNRTDSFLNKSNSNNTIEEVDNWNRNTYIQYSLKINYIFQQRTETFRKSRILKLRNAFENFLKNFWRLILCNESSDNKSLSESQKTEEGKTTQEAYHLISSLIDILTLFENLLLTILCYVRSERKCHDWNEEKLNTKRSAELLYIVVYLIQFIVFIEYLKSLPKSCVGYSVRSCTLKHEYNFILTKRKWCDPKKKFPFDREVFSFRANVSNTKMYDVFPVHRDKIENNPMKVEWYRIGTFNKIAKCLPVNPLDLAPAGFYSTGNGNETQCFHCKAKYSDWKKDDNPRLVHYRISPHCAFLLGNGNLSEATIDQRNGYSNNYSDQRNIPENNQTDSVVTLNGSHHLSQRTVLNGISSEIRDSRQIQPHQNGKEPNGTSNGHFSSNGACEPRCASSPLTETNGFCSGHSGDLHQDAGSISTFYDRNMHNTSQHTGLAASQSRVLENTNNSSQNRKSEKLRTCAPRDRSSVQSVNPNLDGIGNKTPRYPAYEAPNVRISTFQGWPAYLTQTPRDMAFAGFLYAGYGDYVKCHHCGGGLQMWGKDEDPLVEHAFWFPKCHFIRQLKGDEFVEFVRMSRTDQQACRPTEEADNTTNIATWTHPDEGSGRQGGAGVKGELVTLVNAVEEIGYTQERIQHAVRKLQTEQRVINSENILNVLCDEDEIADNLENGQETAAYNEVTNSDPIPTAAGTSANVFSTVLKNGDNATGSDFTRSSEGAVSSLGETESSSSDKNSHSRLSNLMSEEETRSLMEENRQLRDQKLCKICLENDMNIAFLPCGHLVSCNICAPALRRCPICRTQVRGTIKTWLS